MFDFADSVIVLVCFPFQLLNLIYLFCFCSFLKMDVDFKIDVDTEDP